MAVRDIDRGYTRLIEQLNKLGGGVSTTVGIHEREGAEGHPSGGGSIVEVAALGEFGTVDQPPRSFLRSTFDDRRTETERAMVKAATDVARGDAEIKGAMGRVGLELRDAMLERMTDTAPLDEDTVEQRGTTTPLDETGTIRGAMRVRVNGEEVT